MEDESGDSECDIVLTLCDVWLTMICLVVGHYALPAPVTWWCHRSDWLRSAVGPQHFCSTNMECTAWRRCFCAVTVNILAST